MNKTYYFRVTSKEDENKWKEFLGRYFPNCFASEILNKNLLKGQKRRGLHAIGVNSMDTDLYLWCAFASANHHSCKLKALNNLPRQTFIRELF